MAQKTCMVWEMVSRSLKISARFCNRSKVRIILIIIMIMIITFVPSTFLRVVAARSRVEWLKFSTFDTAIVGLCTLGIGHGDGDGHGHGDHDHDHDFENAVAEVFNVLHLDCGDGQDGGEEEEEDDDKTVD